VVYPPTGSRPRQGDEHPAYAVLVEYGPFTLPYLVLGLLGSRVVSMLDSGAEGPCVQIAAATLSGNSLRQTVDTHCASVLQAAKLVAALLRASAGLAESKANRRVYDSRRLQADCQEPGSAPEPYAR